MPAVQHNRRHQGSGDVMWGMVLAIALIAAFDPMRLGIAFVLISQPRPMRTLLAYWLGAMVSAIATAAVLLTVLRKLAPVLADQVAALATSSVAGYLQIALGFAALPLALLVARGVFPRQRSLEMAGAPSMVAGAPGTPSAVARLSSLAENGREERAHWLAFVAGTVTATPPIEYLVVIVAILGSGAAIGIQFGAALMFVVVTLAAIEIPLLSCLATPARSQALMLALHDWVRARARPIFAVIFAVGGLLLIGAGLGNA
jgi:Sap, sulfolipid-1-addressing protein